MFSDFYHKNDNDKIWWIDEYIIDNGVIDRVKGRYLFSFDKIKVFNLFRDYPHELTKEQKVIFDNENSYWADFFKDRVDGKENRRDKN